MRWRLGAGALAALGAAPTVNFGFTASAGVRGPHWSVDLEGRFDLPAGQPTGSVNATGSVETALYLATALPCFHVRLFSGCALLALGAQTADGINLPVTRKSASLFAAAGARAGIEVPLIPKLELRARGRSAGLHHPHPLHRRRRERPDDGVRHAAHLRRLSRRTSRLFSMTESPAPAQDREVDPLCSPAGPGAGDSAVAAGPADFRALYEAEFNYVYNSLRRLGVAERDLEDLIHEVFLAFHRRPRSLRSGAAAPPLAVRDRVSDLSDYRRRAQHRYEVPEEREVADATPGADEQLVLRERRQLVLRALDTLDLDRRAVFVMHEIDGCTMPEIATVLAAPLNTLYSRLRLAREQFATFVRRHQRNEDKGMKNESR